MALAPAATYAPVVRKSRWLILWIVALVIGTAGAGVAGLIVVTVVLGVPYVLTSILTPRTIHRSCAGRGYHRSALFPWATRRCRGCVGGLQVRHGARAIGLPHVRAEHKRRVRVIAKNRQDRTWR